MINGIFEHVDANTTKYGEKFNEHCARVSSLVLLLEVYRLKAPVELSAAVMMMNDCTINHNLIEVPDAPCYSHTADYSNEYRLYIPVADYSNEYRPYLPVRIVYAGTLC